MEPEQREIKVYNIYRSIFGDQKRHLSKNKSGVLQSLYPNLLKTFGHVIAGKVHS